MKIKLVFINCVPTPVVFGEKVDPRWYEGNGFDVEFWDLSRLFFDKLKINLYFSGSDDYRFSPPFEQVFETKSEVAEALKTLPDNSVVYHLTRHGVPLVDDFWMLRILAVNNIPYIVQKLENNFIGAQGETRVKWKEVFKYFQRKIIPLNRFLITVRKLKLVIAVKIKGFVFACSEYYAKPSLAVGVGLAGREDFQSLIDKGVSYLSIPSPLIDWSCDTPADCESLCLFVDESIGYEPDVKFDDMEETADLDVYYAGLKRVFALVEEVAQKRVVIGASGKIAYETNPFDREIVYKKTLFLSRQSSLVIGHSSSALYQSICFKKPVLLLNGPGLTGEKKASINVLSEVTGIHAYNAMTISNTDIASVLEKQSNESLIEAYFCEKGVSGDHRALIASEVEKIVKKRSGAVSTYKQ